MLEPRFVTPRTRKRTGGRRGTSDSPRGAWRGSSGISARPSRGSTGTQAGREADYAEHTSYGELAAADKDRLVDAFVHEVPGPRVWDLGANTGRFSRSRPTRASASSPSTSIKRPPSDTFGRSARRGEPTYCRSSPISRTRARRSAGPTRAALAPRARRRGCDPRARPRPPPRAHPERAAADGVRPVRRPCSVGDRRVRAQR